MRLGIIGNGFVGQATCLLENPEIELIIYDIIPEKCRPQGITLSDLNQCDFIFIAVPTPMNPNGSCHTAILESVVNELHQIITNPECFIINRCTVPVGTSRRLNCYFMPEFLTEKNWKYDFINNPQWIFGLLGNERDVLFKEKITKLFEIAKRYDCIKSTDIYFCTTDEAEVIKYFRNTFLSVKISFCNEIEEYCRRKGVSYKNVQQLATMDSRIGSSHSMVPGHDGRRGYGGTCFPKDTNSLLYDMNLIGMNSYILEGSILRNESVDRPEQDWKSDKGRAFIQ